MKVQDTPREDAPSPGLLVRGYAGLGLALAGLALGGDAGRALALVGTATVGVGGVLFALDCLAWWARRRA
jgi:hypothetical protein